MLYHLILFAVSIGRSGGYTCYYTAPRKETLVNTFDGSLGWTMTRTHPHWEGGEMHQREARVLLFAAEETDSPQAIIFRQAGQEEEGAQGREVHGGGRRTHFHGSHCPG